MSKKYLRFAGFCFAAVLFIGGAQSAQAAVLTTTQINSIVGLLYAFGADASVIANVQAALGGSTPAANPTCLDVSYDLYGGETDATTAGSVSALQAFLGVLPATGYFGPLTEAAVKSWQASHGIVSSGSPDTTGYGYVGPMTRKAMACTSTQNPPPNTSSVTVTLSASTTNVPAGGSSVLTWSSTNATSCTGTSFTASGTSGSVSVSPQATTSYTVTCVGATGSVSQSVTVSVGPAAANAPVITVSASPASIAAGQAATVSWSATNAQSCTSSSLPVSATSGSATVTPAVTTSYAITCVSTDGTASATASAVVTVGAVVATTTPPVVTPPVVTPPIVTTTDVRHIIPAYNASLDAVVAPTTFGTGKIWQVGPTRTYKKPSDVVKLVGNGDIVEIDAGTYVCDQSVRWTANDLTLVGIGGRAVLDASTCALSGDKGIWNPQGNNLIVANIEFVGAHGASANDAGIRYDGSGYFYVTNSYFHGNQNGILSTNNATNPTNIVIDHSEFANNGLGDGFTHNIYVSTGSSMHANSFVFRFNYSHNAKVGHELKSRADSNYILYNRLADEATGNASYQIDLPQGGLSYIIGNVIEKGPSGENSNEIAYSMEGTHNPIQKVYVVNNTIVNNYPSAGSRTALLLNDNNLTEAVMKNNLIVGVPSNRVVAGSGAAKVQLAGNVVTNSPGLYDEANRIYFPTASSPAVGAGVNPGTGSGMSLVPLYEFALPHTGVARVNGTTLDAGAYAFSGTRIVTPAPTLSLTLSQSTIDYQTPAKLNWTTTNADTCTASGGWSGTQSPSGSFTTAPLAANTTFSLSCTGGGGTISAQVSVTVNDSSQADALGTYTWKSIANSALSPLEPTRAEYPDIFGTGGRDPGMGVYVPDNHTWYLLGGTYGRTYYGNEVYAFNLLTGTSKLVSTPTHIKDSKGYNPTNLYGSMISLPGCGAAMPMNDGSTVMAPFDAWSGNMAYDAQLKKIVIGPGSMVSGAAHCSHDGRFGQGTTDAWTFDPFVDTSTPVTASKIFAQVAAPSDDYTSVNPLTSFYDPTTHLFFVGGGNRNQTQVGARIVDYSSGKLVATLVNNVWPFDANGGNSTNATVDTTHHYALGFMATGDGGKIVVWNLNGFSTTAYGTNGMSGTNGTPGGIGPLFSSESGWTVTGNTTILGTANAAITYNSKLDMFVAWNGGDQFYFMKPNYATKTLNIIGKHVYGGPTVKSQDLRGDFLYIPDMDAYLVFTGMANNFAFLVPPGGGTQIASAQTTNGQTATALSGLAAALAGLTASKTPTNAVTPAQSSSAPSLPKMAQGSLYRNLSRGAHGADVTALQVFLAAHGFLSIVNPTDYYGALTQAGVQKYQCSAGIMCTGTPITTGYGAVGPVTRAMLVAQ